jgi:hypothetical protein
MIVDQTSQDSAGSLEEVKVELIRILNASPELKYIVIPLAEDLFEDATRLFIAAGAPDDIYGEIALVLDDGRMAVFTRLDVDE